MRIFGGCLLVAGLLFGAARARAQVHQQVCSSTDAGTSLTLLPGPGHRILVGACGAYFVAHVERGASGLFAVGDATFTWAGAAPAPTDGSPANTLETMRPLVSDFAGGREVELALGFAQFSPHGGGRGGGVYLVPLRDDGSFGRATHPFRGTPAALAHHPGDDGHENLVVVENGEPWAERAAGVSFYARGRRTRRLADVVMAPVFGGVSGAGASAQVLVLAQSFHGERVSSEASLAVAPVSGGAATLLPLPHDAWTGTFADFDGDGATDVAFAALDGIYIASSAVERVRVVDHQPTRVLGLVDLDGSGLHALAFCTNDHLRVATCDATRCWSVPWLGASCESFVDVLIADFDGDGTREMLMANREHYTDDESRSAVWITFVPAPAMHTGVRVVEEPFTPGASVVLR